MRIKESNLKAIEVLKEQKHFHHGIRSSPIRALLFGRFGFDVWKMPVCEKCEGYAFWHLGGTASCPKCGHITPNPLTVEQFYEEGHHVDRTVNPGAPYIAERRVCNATATVFGGEADLQDQNKKIIIARS